MKTIEKLIIELAFRDADEAIEPSFNQYWEYNDSFESIVCDVITETLKLDFLGCLDSGLL